MRVRWDLTCDGVDVQALCGTRSLRLATATPRTPHASSTRMKMSAEPTEPVQTQRVPQVSTPKVKGKTVVITGGSQVGGVPEP